MLTVVNHANFSTTVGSSSGVFVLVLHDFYPDTGSVHQAVQMNAEQTKLFYDQYGLAGVAFGHADVVDRTLFTADVTNVQTLPLTVFYFNGNEFYRTVGILTPEQLKYYIEQMRTA